MIKRFFNIIFILTLTGCAINNTGLVKLRVFENDTVRMVVKEAWGGYLSTNNVDGGFNLGHSEITLFYPKNENAVELSLGDLLLKVQEDDFVEINNDEADFRDKNPIAWITNNEGLKLHTNEIRLGFSLGIDRRNVIRLPKDFDGVFVFRSTSGGKYKAYFHETSSK